MHSHQSITIYQDQIVRNLCQYFVANTPDELADGFAQIINTYQCVDEFYAALYVMDTCKLATLDNLHALLRMLRCHSEQTMLILEMFRTFKNLAILDPSFFQTYTNFTFGLIPELNTAFTILHTYQLDVTILQRAFNAATSKEMVKAIFNLPADLEAFGMLSNHNLWLCMEKIALILNPHQANLESQLIFARNQNNDERVLLIGMLRPLLAQSFGKTLQAKYVQEFKRIFDRNNNYLPIIYMGLSILHKQDALTTEKLNLFLSHLDEFKRLFDNSNYNSLMLQLNLNYLVNPKKRKFSATFFEQSYDMPIAKIAKFTADDLDAMQIDDVMNDAATQHSINSRKL